MPYNLWLPFTAHKKQRGKALQRQLPFFHLGTIERIKFALHPNKGFIENTEDQNGYQALIFFLFIGMVKFCNFLIAHFP